MDEQDTERQRRFRDLYEAHYGHVLAFALRRTDNPSDAHEIVADTFLVVWRRFDDVPTGDETLPWLYGVARLVLANSRRSRRRRTMLQERLGVQPQAPVELEDTVGRLAEGQAVREALQRLRPDDQELLRLVAWEELSHRAIGQVLGCSENAVAIRLHRARQRLAAQLAKETGRTGHKQSRKEPPQFDPGGEDHH
jgi:RNA polymerase sigma factor (sigma-70 family)